jgi:excisionase family DNA binding protein
MAMTTEQQWAVSPAEAAKLLGLPIRTFYDRVMPHVYGGTIQSAKIGRNRRIDVDSLRDWWKQQMTYTSDSH